VLNLYKYNESFFLLFKKEKEKLKQILGTICLIEHIGSTAIPEVDGKGIIDIMLIFKDQDKIKNAVELLQKKDYFLASDKIERKNRVFMSSAGNRESDFGDIHLHLTTKNNDDYLNAILFRDFLKKHPHEKKEYIDLKYKLFNKVDGNRLKYTELKSDFIKKIIDLAKNKN